MATSDTPSEPTAAAASADNQASPAAPWPPARFWASWRPAGARARTGLAASEVARVRQLMARKYRIDRLTVLPVYRLVQAIAHGRRAHADSVVLMITPGS